MISILYDRRKYSVTVKGHAKSDEYGRDLVCAAVSALVITLATNVEHLDKYGLSNNTVIKLDAGDANIRCAVVEKYKLSVAQIFNTVCVGFEVLSRVYPEYITYQVVG